MEVAVQVIGVQRRDDQASLVPPFVSLGDEHASETRFVRALLQLVPAPVTLRTVPQDRVDRLNATDTHDTPRAKIEAKDRAIAPAPVLGHGMQRARAHLMRITQER